MSLAGADQAGDTPNYEEGAKGYGQRFGASYTTGFADIMIGEALLPSLLHQDPRYFYEGTCSMVSIDTFASVRWFQTGARSANALDQGMK